MSGVVNWSKRRKMLVGPILVVVILLVSSFLVVYRVPSFVHIESPPVYWTDVTSDQHVVEYHKVVADENITVGEMGLTWDIWFVSEEDEDYDYYELRIHHSVSGAPGDGLIKGGESLLELNSVNQSIDSCSEEHGTGAVETNLISNVSWGGSIPACQFTLHLVKTHFHKRFEVDDISRIVPDQAIQCILITLLVGLPQ